MDRLSEGYKRTIDKKKHFSAKRINGRCSVIPAGTRSVVIVGHFLMAQTVPPSSVDHGPKLRVLIIGKWEWPEMAKNRGEPRKMKGKVVAPGILVISPDDKNRDSKTKN